MHVTLLCDASYCAQHKVAGYGFWIASERGKLGGGGAIDQDVENNNTAEMMAICNVIWQGIANGLIHQGDSLLVQSDCLSAMDKLKGVQNSVTVQEKAVLTYFEKTIRRHELAITFKHVRAHTGKKDKRYVANQMCDKRAKFAMRQARSLKIVKEIKESLQ